MATAIESDKLHHLRRTLVGMTWALVLLFVIYQWNYSGGYPYIRDGNESALSFVHALNLKLFDAAETGYLTTYDTDFDKPAAHPNYIYTHNPNFPRYVHYALLLLGIDSFTNQVLLITIAVTIANLLALHWLLRVALGPVSVARWLALVPLVTLACDYLGFLSFTVNTYRTYCFCLLWFSLLAVRQPWGFCRIFAVFFVLCQLEYGFASFVLGSAGVYWLASGRPGGLRTLMALLSGTLASVLVYFGQLRSCYSLAFILNDLQATAARRGHGAAFASYWADAIPAFGLRLAEIQSPLQNGILIWALVSAGIRVARRGGAVTGLASALRALAVIYLSLVAGGLVGSVAMTNYFYEAFFGGILPFLTFFNAIAAGLACGDGVTLIQTRAGFAIGTRRALAFATGAAMLAPMAANSFRWWREHPGLRGDYVRILAEEYRGKPIMVMSHFNQLPTALTWGPTLHLTDQESRFEDTDYTRFERYRDQDGNLTLLCLNLRWVGFESLIAKLLARGDELLQHGPDFAFIRIKGPAFLRSESAMAAPAGAYGAVRLHLAPLLERSQGRLPLLAAGNAQSGSLVYLQAAGPGRWRVGFDGGSRGALITPPFPVDPAEIPVVEISHGSLYPPAAHPAMRALDRTLAASLQQVLHISWNGRPMISTNLPLPPIAPDAIRIGQRSDFPDTSEPPPAWILARERRWPATLGWREPTNHPGDAVYGALELVVEFPLGAAGRVEPLVTSGLTGAGNFVYVRYLDDRRIAFGFDHWGVAGYTSEPVLIEPGREHRLVISMGSLYPPAGDPWYEAIPPAINIKLKHRVVVQYDGRSVLAIESPAHESPPEFVHIGKNGIGGSTTGPAFTGRIATHRRMTQAELPATLNQ